MIRLPTCGSHRRRAETVSNGSSSFVILAAFTMTAENSGRRRGFAVVVRRSRQRPGFLHETRCRWLIIRCKKQQKQPAVCSAPQKCARRQGGLNGQRGDTSSSGGIVPFTRAQPLPAVADASDRVYQAAAPAEISRGYRPRRPAHSQKMTRPSRRGYNDIEGNGGAGNNTAPETASHCVIHDARKGRRR
jgi:hypothetical protein